MDDPGANRAGGRGMKPAGETTRSVGAFNRFGRWALAGFFFGFGMLFLSLIIPLKSGAPVIVKGVLVISGVLVMIGSAVAFVVALIARDAVASGRKPWSFSLRTLLIAITLVAVVLGVIAMSLRHG